MTSLGCTGIKANRPRIELVDYVRSDCELHKHGLLIGVYRLTNGNPCIGCVYFENCTVVTTLMSKANVNTRNKMMYETNKETAARMGITPRQVSKMRKAGRL